MQENPDWYKFVYNSIYNTDLSRDMLQMDIILAIRYKQFRNTLITNSWLYTQYGTIYARTYIEKLTEAQNSSIEC